MVVFPTRDPMSSSSKETASLLNLRHYPEFRRIYKHEIRDFDTGSSIYRILPDRTVTIPALHNPKVLVALECSSLSRNPPAKSIHHQPSCHSCSVRPELIQFANQESHLVRRCAR